MGYTIALKGGTNIILNGTALYADNINNRLLAVSLSNEYKVLSFNSSTFEYAQIGNTYTGTSATAVYAIGFDGTYYYFGRDNGGASTCSLLAFTFDGTDLALVGTYDFPSNSENVLNILCDTSGYIHTVTYDGYLKAFTFNGSSFNLVATYSLNIRVGGGNVGLKYDGTYFYKKYHNVSNTAYGVQALTFNGSSYTMVNFFEVAGATYQTFLHDGTYIIHLNGSTLQAYTFDGANFSQVGNTFSAIPYVAKFKSIVFDGTYYYISSGGTNVRIFTFDGTDFTELAPYIDSLVANFAGQEMEIFNSCIHYNRTAGLSANGVNAIRMNLAASFAASKLSGYAPLSVDFTAT